MSRRRRFPHIFLVAIFLCAPACEEEPQLPPDDAEPTSRPESRLPDLDLRHTATVLAGSKISFPNVVFVFQSAGGGQSGITLYTTRPLADGSRLVFGAVESVSAPESLMKTPIQFGGAALLDPSGNGIFTPRSIYQPKFAELKVTSVDDKEVIGAIKGQFYRFLVANPVAKPKVEEVEVAFTALRFKP